MSDAMPGAMSLRIAMNSTPNKPKPRKKPFAISSHHDTAGRRIKSSHGTQEKKNRSVANNNGGSSPRPSLMMTKFVPQTTMTARASKR